jgi:hypothetical protein
MTTARLKEHFVAAEVVAGSMYKFGGASVNEEAWSRVAEYFEKFRAFYMEAGKHGDGVIICVD